MNPIQFITNDPLIAEHFPPVPSEKFLPNWYADLKVGEPLQSAHAANVKNCLPVKDLLCSGYIMFNAYQTHIEEKFVDFQNSLFLSTMKQPAKNDIRTFKHKQCPFTDKPKDSFKIKLDWKIKTPPGYSCLIQQIPFVNNTKYKILPAIIDTDEFDDCISIAGILLEPGPVYLEPGEALIQIIPFKRDSWQMDVSVQPIHSKITHYLFDGYKTLFHKIKTFI